MSTDKWDCRRTDAAEFFGVSLPTIDAWIRKGCPVKERNARGGIAKLNLADMARHRIMTAQGRDRDPVAERARRDSESADKLALENARTRGEMLLLDPVTDLCVGLVTDAKQRLLGLPTKLAPQVVEVSIPVAERLLEDAISDSLRGIAGLADGDMSGLVAASQTYRKPVGRPPSKAKQRSERGAGAVEHGSG